MRSIALLISNQLRISHLLHLRAEVCSETLEDELAGFRETPRVKIVSLMDHSPGQRQFRDIDQLRVYLKGKHNMTDQQVDEHFVNTAQLHQRVAERHRDLALSFARDADAVITSHDDTTAGMLKWHVQQRWVWQNSRQQWKQPSCATATTSL